ncbi:MAG: homocysteine S-methyltransferase family protein [Kiritimatiellae bacterium]|nr:homocysteine S-methyltransferase family protein [Kiritimatiellia bacterium]
MNLSDHPMLFLDGACGTNLQLMDIPASAWEGREGCNELLNVTAPETIELLHRSFYEAGAMAVETNTFGASSIVLAEYGLEYRVREINAAAVACARRAAGGDPNRYIVGSVGPTTKLATLGHITVEALAEALGAQMRALLEAGVDALMIETCQDLLQVKTAVVAAYAAMQAERREVPLMVSVTIEQTGTMLVGTDIAAVCATLEPYPIFSLGLNCATGPAAMESHLRYLSHHWPRRISCVPNAGLPEVRDGRTAYPLGPDEFAAAVRHLVEREGVRVVGGCCGTTPAHIRALVGALRGVTPAERTVS